MKLQEAVARQIANNEARTEISGIDIADAGNVLQVVIRFLQHNLRIAISEEVMRSIEEDHMP